MRRSIITALAATSALALGACGGTTQPAADDRDADGAAAAGPISLTDSAGRTVELAKPAERVVVLEWQQTEDVLTLGVEPVGAADVKGYNTWVTAEELDASTKDVGTRGEPNMDAVFSTNPDLVIVEAERGAPIIKQLEKYDVPVLVTKGADVKDPVGNMKATFTLIGEALGKQDEARDVLADFDEAVAEAKEEIAEAKSKQDGAENTSFVFADAWLDGSNIAIRPFGQGSLVGELGESIGLTNAWKGEVDEAYGLGQTDVEGIAAIGDAHFFFNSTDALHEVDGATPWMPELEKNRIWKNAGFVNAGNVHPFPAGVWTFGGPESSEQIIDAFTEAFTG